MHTFSRIGLVSVMTFAVTLASPLLVSADDTAPAMMHSLSAATDSHPFMIADAKGHYLALHFLTKTDTTECTAFVREYLRAAPGVAGVMHVFIKPDEQSEVKVWSMQFKNDAAAIFVDKDSALANDLKVPGGLAIASTTSNFPATIVFDREGRELFRHVGKSHDDHMLFTEFAARINGKTKQPALAHYNLPKNTTLALEGYDLVSYFRANKATKGKTELTSTYRAVTYQFSTEENRKLFAADPEKYLPTYGGWCASAMGAKGTKVEIDPTNYKVTNGRLFLFYKDFFSDALKDWNKHEKDWEPAADANWKKLTKE